MLSRIFCVTDHTILVSPLPPKTTCLEKVIPCLYWFAFGLLCLFLVCFWLFLVFSRVGPLVLGLFRLLVPTFKVALMKLQLHKLSLVFQDNIWQDMYT